MGDTFSGLLVPLHLCTSWSLDFVFSIFHTPSCSCLWDSFCNTYNTIYLLLFLPLPKPFFDLPLSFWIYFGLGGLGCEWVVRFELPRCRNLPRPCKQTVSHYSWLLRSWSPRIGAAHLCFLIILLLFSIAVPRVDRDYMVGCQSHACHTKALWKWVRQVPGVHRSWLLTFHLCFLLESFDTVVYTLESGPPPPGGLLL